MHRVVVTGYGALSPLGLSAEETWEAIKQGKSGIGPITRFDTTDFPIKVAAELKDFHPENLLDRRDVRRQDRFQHLAGVAAAQALQHSGLQITEENSTRIGVIVSSGVGGIDSMMEQIIVNHEQGYRRINPFTIPRIMTNGAASVISIGQGIRGPSLCVTSACASSSDGLGVALYLLRAGMIDAALSGGAEASISSFGLGSFERIGAYSSRTELTPSPFSATRDGFVMGEGAAIMVLETLEHARARGATIYGEFLGYGSSADAYHLTAPSEDGSGSANAIRAALADGRLTPADIDYINAHGTGTHLNDVAETKALKAALGQRAYEIPVSSTKSMTGHMMGGTGALEALFCLLTIRDSILPPTINYTEPDPNCDLDYVPNQPREKRVRIALSNSFGFGGHNSVLAFGRFDG